MSMNSLAKIKLAYRNAIKNKRRSLITITSVSVGFLALSLFEGYFTYIYQTLEDQAVIGERLGHLTITKKDFYEKSSIDPHKYMFEKPEVDGILEALGSNEKVSMVSPRLKIDGLISNGAISRIFISEGIDPKDIIRLRGDKYANLPGKLDVNQYNAGVFGQKLADYLNISVNDEAVLMTSTIDGMVNAVDIKVGEIANTGSVGTDDKAVLMPIDLARKLYDFDGADRIVVLLTSSEAIPNAKQEIEEVLSKRGLDIEVSTWNELSLYYNQVKSLFDMMYLFISIVVSIVVIASIANTMGMSISERTREIGTLRAIGLRTKALISLFVYEGVLIVFVGCVLGIAISYAAAALINGANITYVPPDASVEADLILVMLFENLFGSLFTLTILAMVASYFPARRASRKTIVGALGHV